MIRDSTQRLCLAVIALLAFVEPVHPQQSLSRETPWRQIDELDSQMRITLQAPAGSRSLIVFVGNSGAQARTEISAYQPTLTALGYSILTTYKREVEASDNPLQANEMLELMNVGARRPGFNERVLLVPGQQLHAVLAFIVARRIESYGTLVVIHPGLAWPRRNAVNDLLGALPEGLELIWAHSGQGNEAYFARELARGIPESTPWRDIRVANPATSENLRAHLQMLRLTLNWESADEAFPGGCAFDSGAVRSPIDRLQTSGGRGPLFCPLFLRAFGSTDLWVARNVSGGVCMYRVADGTSKLYCNSQ